MTGTEELRTAIRDYLSSQGLAARCAWQEGEREAAGEAVAVISLRGMEGGSPGFQDYLGERYDAQLQQWVELYGKRVKLTFGVDVYGASAQIVGRGLDKAAELLGAGRPGGLKMLAFSAGETEFRKEDRRYCCPAQAEFEAWAFGRAREDGSFLDFVVRGVTRV